MTELDLELPGVVDDILGEFGNATVVYTVNAPGTYNPVTRRAAPVSSSMRIAAAVASADSGTDANQVEGGRKRLTMSPVAFAGRRPSPGDGFFVDGAAYAVDVVRGVYSGDLVAAWIVEGDATGTATSTGIIDLTGSIVGMSAVVASFTKGLQLQGYVSASANFGAEFRIGLRFAGSIAGASSVASVFRLGRKLSGAVSVQSAFAGNFKVSSGFNGAIVGQSAFAGNFTLGKKLSGVVVGAGSVAGTFRLGLRLSGAVAGATAFGGTLRIGKRLAGSIDGATAFAGTIRKGYRLSGSIIGAGLFAGTFTKGTAPAEDADTTALVARMTVPPDSTRRLLINDLIVGLKADGIWNKLYAIYLLAAHDRQAGRLNWKPVAGELTETNVVTFTTDRGFNGNGVDSRLNLPHNFTTMFPSPDDISAGGWVNNWVDSGQFMLTSAVLRYSMTVASTTSYVLRVMTSSNTSITNQPVTNRAHVIGVRTGPNGGDGFVSIDGVFKIPIVGVGTTVPNGFGSILQGASFTANRMAAVYAGNALTQSEATALHNRLNTFLTAIGAN